MYCARCPRQYLRNHQKKSEYTFISLRRSLYIYMFYIYIYVYIYIHICIHIYIYNIYIYMCV